jgi:signal transduction histidine kinase/ligand-binding sensor domain-containing protein
MPNKTDLIYKPPVILFVCLFFSGCWLSHHPIPLPANESEYAKPVLKTFKFTTPTKFKWNNVPSDSIHPGKISPFDFTNLEAMPFYSNGFHPLPNPPVPKAFHYNNLPDTILNLDAIASQPLVFKTTVLGAPKQVTLGLPKIKAESYFTSFQYSTEQGIPSQHVVATLHAKNGSLWIATNEGISVLSGQILEILPANYGDIFEMAEDGQGLVWVRTRENGVYVINRKEGIQKQAPIPFGVDVRIDKKGFIWVASLSDGIYLISPDQKTFKHITNKNGLSSSQIARTFEDGNGRIWISNLDKGIDILDPSLKKIKRLGKAQGLGNGIPSCLFENKQGDMCIALISGGIDLINIQNETIRHLDSVQGIHRSFIFSMQEDDKNNLWIETDSSGLYLLNKNFDSVAHILEQDGLAGNSCNFLDMDNENRMFVSTRNGGINIFPPADQVAHHISKKDGLIGNDVWGLMEDSKQRIWIGTHSGLNIITADRKKILQYQPGGLGKSRVDPFLQTAPDEFMTAGPGGGVGLFIINESKKTIENIGLKQGLPSVQLYNLFQDSQGLIWIGTTDPFIIVFDPKSRSIRYLNLPAGTIRNTVSQIIEDAPGIYLIAMYGTGILRLDMNDSTISSCTSKEGLSDNEIISLIKDKKNRIWAASEKGINLLDLKKETNTVFSQTSGLPAKGIYSFLQKDGRIYAGTGRGLSEIQENETGGSQRDEPSWNLQTFGKPQGFPFLDFNARACTITGSGQCWWGIVEGITTLETSVFLKDSTPEPVQVSGIDILGKAQYFIDPELIKDADTVWTDNRDSFYLNGSFGKINTDRDKGIKWDSLNANNLPVNLSLPPERNYLRFHFSNILPQYEGEYKYMYILDGVDEKWSTVTDQPFSENYNNISPGYYNFRVSVKKDNGAWSEPSSFHLRIRPPWWFSWWAELIYFLIFVGLLRLWVNYRSRWLLNENAKLEQKVTERTAELSTSLENLRQAQGQLIQAEKMASLGELTAGIAHEIQNPLNFVNNFSEVNTELIEDMNKALDDGDIPEVKGILKDVEMNMGKITFHGKRADAIVKGMLLHSRASSGQKIPTDVNALADEYLRLSYHGLRAKDKSFNAQFEMDFDKTLQPIMLVQQNIGRVLLNLFNNSFYSVTEKKKQFPDGYQPSVSVSTKRNNGMVEIRIRDNGQGIPKKVIDKIYQPFFTTKPAGQGTGLGLSLSYDIITKEHGGKINVTTKENEFTEFIIELPVLKV